MQTFKPQSAIEIPLQLTSLRVKHVRGRGYSWSGRMTVIDASSGIEDRMHTPQKFEQWALVDLIVQCILYVAEPKQKSLLLI